MMGRNKIHRSFGGFTKSEKFFYPCFTGCSRSADFQNRVNFFNSGGCVLVKFKIIFLTARPEGVEVGLIPHFEKLAAYFFNSISIYPMLDQLFYECSPCIVVTWWSNISFIMKYNTITGRQCQRHKESSTNGFMPVLSRKSKI